jgi:hypothetical protein
LGGWKERLKHILDLPPDARIVTKPYYRKIIKRNGKVYRALTVQYVLGGRRRYKHIPKSKEPHVMVALLEDKADISRLLADLKSFLQRCERDKKEGKEIKRELTLLLTSLLTKDED